jgi:hypothetical protein
MSHPDRCDIELFAVEPWGGAIARNAPMVITSDGQAPFPGATSRVL